MISKQSCQGNFLVNTFLCKDGWLDDCRRFFIFYQERCLRWILFLLNCTWWQYHCQIIWSDTQRFFNIFLTAPPPSVFQWRTAFSPEAQNFTQIHRRRYLLQRRSSRWFSVASGGISLAIRFHWNHTMSHRNPSSGVIFSTGRDSVGKISIFWWPKIPPETFPLFRWAFWLEHWEGVFSITEVEKTPGCCEILNSALEKERSTIKEETALTSENINRTQKYYCATTVCLVFAAATERPY